jgi:hypothetical protein
MVIFLDIVYLMYEAKVSAVRHLRSAMPLFIHIGDSFICLAIQQQYVSVMLLRLQATIEM